jgi:hypothetical protein
LLGRSRKKWKRCGEIGRWRNSIVMGICRGSIGVRMIIMVSWKRSFWRNKVRKKWWKNHREFPATLKLILIIHHVEQCNILEIQWGILKFLIWKMLNIKYISWNKK